MKGIVSLTCYVGVVQPVKGDENVPWTMMKHTCPVCRREFEGRSIRVYCSQHCQRSAQWHRYVGRADSPLDPVKSLNGRIAMAVRYRRPELELELRAELARWHAQRADASVG